MGIKYGVAESIGFRSQMEDSHALWDIDDEHLFAAEVYDGHVGSRAAVIAAEILTPYFLSFLRAERAGGPTEGLSFRERIRKAYLSTDAYIIGQKIRSGAAAATLHIMEGKFCAANSGDSRVIIDTRGGAVQLSVDHKPDLPAEKERIEGLGGKVVFLDTPRLQGMLAMSRALGDVQLRPFLTPEPHVVEGLLAKENRFAILACDGVWDVLTPEEAMIIVHKEDDPQRAADAIQGQATARGSTDNITVIVLDLRPHTGGLGRDRMEIIAVLDKGSE
jgi:protein phosphatase 1L